ncbi:MAG: hypothetical protein AAFV31_14780 [Pseudomonadota bacterium]
MDARLEFRLTGSFSIRDQDGNSALPSGSKTRALIALLLTSHDLSRPRAWIQDLLWSTRGSDQKAASLRQCLAELRRTWTPYPGVLHADRQRIWLDPSTVQIVTQQPGIFLEDLSIRDPAFNAWLGLQRLQNSGPDPRAAVAQPATRSGQKRQIAIAIDVGHDQAGLDLVAVGHDILVQMLYETGTVDLLRPTALDGHRPDRLMTLSAMAQPDGVIQMRCVLEAPKTAHILWTGQKPVMTRGVDPAGNAGLMSFCNQILEAACRPDVPLDLNGQALGASQDVDLTSQTSMAISSIFSIRSDLLQSAITTLETLLADSPQPVLYGWLAQAYTIQYVERYRPADAELRERCEAACREALAGGGQNSNVLAAVANARTNINHNYLAGLQLAEQSIKCNVANPLAWWAYSNALQCVGRSEMAHRAACNAQLLADATQLQFWADFQVSLTAALLGDTATAIENGERSVALVPDFRPPLRYLTALYAMDGDTDALTRSTAALKAAELDFSMTQMIEDIDYPIGMMRRYGKDLTRALRNAAGESDQT